MIQLILFLLVAALLLASLLLLARRSSRAEGGAEALVEARQALTYLQTGLLPPEIIGRFFASEDFEFVASAGAPGVYSLFCHERQKIVLAWLAQVRMQVNALRRFHLGAARFYARLTLRSEVALAADFASLLITCRVLQVLVYLGGPRIAPNTIGAAAAAGLRICDAYQEALAFLSARPPAVNRSIAS
jgi:hypothetical protein